MHETKWTLVVYKNINGVYFQCCRNLILIGKKDKVNKK